MTCWCVRRLATAVFVVSLLITRIFSAEIHLSWNPNPESDIAGYRIYATDLSSGAHSVFQAGTDCRASFLAEEGHSYSFTVTAYNFASMESAHSSEVLYNAQAEKLTVTWDPSVYSTVVEYRLSYGVLNQVAQQVSVGAGTSIQLSGLQRGSTYFFYVEGFDSNGARKDAWKQITAVVPVSGALGGVHIPRVNLPPQIALSSPSASSVYTAPASITLSATASDPEGAIRSVEFYSGSTRLATDTTSPYSFTWSGVPAGSYQLSAVATDAQGASARANVSITVKGLVPPAPTALYATQVDDSIKLRWTHTSPDETGFMVYRSTGGTYDLLAVLDADAVEYSDIGLTMGSTYSYRVTAFNAIGSSAPAEVSFTTRVPGPDNITATAVAGAIVVGWDASIGATQYHIDRALSSAGPFQTVGTTQITQWTDTQVTPGTRYYYRAVAEANGDRSVFSSVVSAVVTVTSPAAPDSLTAMIEKGELLLVWMDRSNNETNFYVERSLDGESFSRIATLPANSTSFLDSTVAPRRRYYYRVASANSADTSFSETISARAR